MGIYDIRRDGGRGEGIYDNTWWRGGRENGGWGGDYNPAMLKVDGIMSEGLDPPKGHQEKLSNQIIIVLYVRIQIFID